MHISIGQMSSQVSRSTRTLRRRPRFALGVIACWTLGVAAAATTSSLADAFFFRPPAGVTNPEQVVRLYEQPKDGEVATATKFSFPQFASIARALPAADVAAYATSPEPVVLQELSTTLNVGFVSAGYFRLMGTKPVVGTLITASEPGVSTSSITISDRVWRKYFGARTEIVGQRVRIRSHVFTVAGLAPRGFSGGEAPSIDAWVALDAAADLMKGKEWRTAEAWWLTVVARVTERGDVTPLEAAASAALATERDRQEQGLRSGPRIRTAGMAPGAASRASATGRTVILVAVAGLALLVIASINIGGLFLLRALARQRELAVRRALGAPSSAVILDVLAEVGILAICAGALSIPLVLLLSGLVSAFVLPGADLFASLLQPRSCVIVAGATAAASLVTAVIAVFGALFVPPLPSLGSGRSTDTRKQHFLRSAFIGMQVAATTALVAGSFLLASNLGSLKALDLGVSVSNVMLVSLGHSYATEFPVEASRFLSQLEERVRLAPGVHATSRAVTAPFLTSNGVAVNSPDHLAVWQNKAGVPYLNAVGIDYFRVTGMRLWKGRTFAASDTGREHHVALINQTFARVAWADGDPVGHCIVLGADRRNPCFEIIGVVADSRRFSMVPEEAAMQVFIPMSQNIFEDMIPVSVLLVKVDDNARVRGALVRAVSSIAPLRADVEIASLEDVVDPQLRPWRTAGALWRLFGLTALILTGIGVYGALAYAAELRRKEVAIRRALGARTRQLLTNLGGWYLSASLIGVVLGSAVMMLASRVAVGFLEATRTAAPFHVAIAGAAVSAIVLLSSVVPVLAAMKTPLGHSLSGD
jgi:putative ABC transport system permease protein